MMLLVFCLLAIAIEARKHLAQKAPSASKKVHNSKASARQKAAPVLKGKSAANASRARMYFGEDGDVVLRLLQKIEGTGATPDNIAVSTEEETKEFAQNVQSIFGAEVVINPKK